jgi:hypothetical protein
MTIAMTMKIKFDPSIVLAFLTCCAQLAASPAQACPAACDGDWNHALRAAAHCFLPRACSRQIRGQELATRAADAGHSAFGAGLENR